MSDTTYNPIFEVEHSYDGFSVVARPGVGIDTASTTVDEVFKSPDDARRWIEAHGAAWAAEIARQPGQATLHHRSL